MRLITALVIMLSVFGCGACHDPTVAVKDVVDCALLNQSDIAQTLSQILGAITGQTPDWAKAESDAISAGEAVGGCALAKAAQQQASGSNGKFGASESQMQLNRILADFKAKTGNKTYKTEAGEI